ncbi:MAG: aspartate-semialdehyde dehydrogenase [Firmicutes bacterium]|nr:aspartate-semialdehyde dehydrogenase [Bacillota bacterium]
MSSGYHVAIAGATGAVGTEFLRVLERHDFPIASLRLLASERSEGKRIRFAGEDLVVQRLTENAFEGVQIAFFSAGASRSRQFAPAAVRAGAVVIDNSSAFRMDPQVPLVVPEINIDDAQHHQGIIANPNCSTIIMLMAVAPLHRRWRAKRVVVSTYQAASGAGAQAMQELLDQTAAVLEGKEVTPRVLPHQIAFNLFSHNSAVNEYGYNEEEWKMIHESRKILHEPGLAITATCVRVPVLRAHSESINIEFAERRPSVEEARQALAEFPGVKLVDDRERNHFPMPIEATDREEVLVGRIREDVSNPMALDLFVSGDQLLKGAALNAVQIAEAMITRRWL